MLSGGIKCWYQCKINLLRKSVKPLGHLFCVSNWIESFEDNIVSSSRISNFMKISSFLMILNGWKYPSTFQNLDLSEWDPDISDWSEIFPHSRTMHEKFKQFIQIFNMDFMKFMVRSFQNMIYFLRFLDLSVCDYFDWFIKGNS